MAESISELAHQEDLKARRHLAREVIGKTHRQIHALQHKYGAYCPCGELLVYKAGMCKRCWEVAFAAHQLPLFNGEVPMQTVEPPKVAGSTLHERFQTFHRLNPAVWNEIQRIARTMLEKGMKRLSINMIFELMRYDYAVFTQGDDYKLNNSYRAFYARMLDAQPWIPADAVETRKRRTL